MANELKSFGALRFGTRSAQRLSVEEDTMLSQQQVREQEYRVRMMYVSPIQRSHRPTILKKMPQVKQLEERTKDSNGKHAWTPCLFKFRCSNDTCSYFHSAIERSFMEQFDSFRRSKSKSKECWHGLSCALGSSSCSYAHDPSDSFCVQCSVWGHLMEEHCEFLARGGEL